MASPNAGMREHWNEAVGPDWVREQERLDTQLQPLGLLAVEALGPLTDPTLLDVGCGCGGSTLVAAALAGERGHVRAVDISRPMLERARERVEALGLGHRVDLLLADAQDADLGRARFDGALSRFGVMFFDDPVAAFSNIRRALRPGAPMAFVCWRARELNPWFSETSAAAAAHVEVPASPPPGTPGPFGLADEALILRVLADAGFEAAAVHAVDTVMLTGASLDDAVDSALAIGPVARALSASDAGREREQAVANAVRDVLSAYARPDGVRVPVAVWVVTARCRAVAADR
ncbi:MAG: class I SAM-dependent methyltransferase [Gaiellales bacterium]